MIKAKIINLLKKEFLNMNKIEATVVADSINPQKDRLTSVLVTMPRIILSEMNTHRMLSKNTSSSRAIPFKKMVEAVQENPFIPIAWQKEHTGMQGNEYITDEENIQTCVDDWLVARNSAIESAKTLNKGFNKKDEQGNWIKTEEIDFVDKVTKQLCNRLLEPFMWTTMLITGSKEGWDNFFNLRCPVYYYAGNDKSYKSKKELLPILLNDFGEAPVDSFWHNINKGQAEIHMMALAESIYDAMNESTPKQLQAGEWHVPFEDKIQIAEDIGTKEQVYETKVKISTAMAARTSYTIVGDEKEIDYQKMVDLHDRLLSQDPPHSSPLEHCARAMSDEEYVSFIKGVPDMIEYEKDEIAISYLKTYEDSPEAGWCNNLKGFIPYRYMIDNNLI